MARILFLIVSKGPFMSTSLDSVTAQAMNLSPADCAELIERLVSKVMPAPPLHPSWDAEIARRVAELDAGMVKSIPSGEVFAKARALIDASTRST
jgi:putative addiction module component (TIGR02574 family)